MNTSHLAIKITFRLKKKSSSSLNLAYDLAHLKQYRKYVTGSTYFKSFQHFPYMSHVL